MKKIIKFLFTSFLVLGILLGSTSCIFSSKIIEDYKDYRCYDYHLKYLNTSKSIGKYTLENANTIYNIDYKKIMSFRKNSRNFENPLYKYEHLCYNCITTQKGGALWSELSMKTK